jgi:uncharacterized GH25 family protein
MRRSILLFCFFMLCKQFMFAQDLWLRSDKYFYDPSEKAKVELVAGQDFIPESAGFQRESLERLEVFFRNVNSDIRKNFVEGDKSSFTVDLSAEGLYRYFFQTKSMTKTVDGLEFNEYLKQYGLDEIYSEREKNNLVNDSAVISKTSFVKGYLRTGKQIDRRPEESTGLPIEIIPDKNPLTLDKGDKITFTVFKNNKPAFGVRVKIWNRWNNRTTIQHIFTLQDGTVNIQISSPGDWMVSVVDLTKSSEENKYIAESFNLVFGYR